MAHGPGEVVAGHGPGGPQGLPGSDHVTSHEEHPTESIYIRVAAILAGVTLIEVVIYYIDWVHDQGILVPALLILSAFKFVAVVGYFMHLKFDDKRFTWLFVSGLAVAASIILALYALFHYHALDYAQGLIG